MVLEKENAVLGNRELMGATNPKEAVEGTIRKKYGISIDKNSVHGSDSVENAKIEIEFFFKRLAKNFIIAAGYNLCSCFKTFFDKEAGLSLVDILTFFCKIILPESNFALT